MLTQIDRKQLNDIQQDRCVANINKSLDWDKLTISQQFSISNIAQFGYQLSFIRFVNGSPVAILILKDKIASISEDGMINIKSNTACK